MSNLHARLKKIEAVIQPKVKEVIVLRPTDEEYFAYHNGEKPLPTKEYTWDLSLLSEETLDWMMKQWEEMEFGSN
ncbi:MAG TPA: hypothetical protein VEY51_12155 [Chondromyces sp.]|nr:hypothetical protein [Chondromyces sp.]